MNYFIDFIPNTTFINEINKLSEKLKGKDEFIANIYIKQLPAMNANKDIYCDIQDGIQCITELKKNNIKVNIMLDTFCFGNKEFTKAGKGIFDSLDQLLEYDIDFITVTNNFFLNYIKRRYSKIKIIMSEFSEITNVQKIDRYIENIGAYGVKVDFKLSLNFEVMQYIKNHFDINRIYIDTNKIYYDNDIYRDSLNNSLAHYIQENKWIEAKKCIEEHNKNQVNLGNERIDLKNENFNQLKKLGYTNFWYYFNFNEDNEKYIKQLKRFGEL